MSIPEIVCPLRYTLLLSFVDFTGNGPRMRPGKPSPTTVVKYANCVVDSVHFVPSTLLAAHIKIGVSRFAFGPEALQDWDDEQLSQNLSPNIRQLLIKLRPYELENLRIKHRGRVRRIAVTWILNQESICLLLDSAPLWPDDKGNRTLAWQFFRHSHLISYLNYSQGLVSLLYHRQGESLHLSSGL